MPNMKLRKIKKPKKYKFIFNFIVIYLVFSYTFYYSFKNIANKTNEEFIMHLLADGNSHIIVKRNIYNEINKTISFLTNIDITKPVTLFNESIIGISNKKEESTEDLEKLKAISSYIDDPNKREIKNPLIYIYNSHQLENYNNDNLSIYGITPNVLMASYLLKEKLNESGYETIVENTNLTEFLELNNWPYYESYRASRIFILDKKTTYPSIKYFIDIHRDSIKKEESTITIGDKNYAKILFVIGLDHNNHEANYQVTNKINNLFDTYYPGLSRGIYKKTGPDVNGIYNQDISPYVMLIEVGGVDNNIEEVLNTINAISDILGRFIDEEK